MTRCKDLFAEAAGLLPADRTAMLDRACADDPKLRADVERLLAAFDGAGDFLESSAIERSSISRWLDRTGTVIGNYIVREPLGEGGMGVVWKAEQTTPVRREVALKLLKPGTESRHVLARFEAERRALERMEHPNIARVLDAGTTESGRPYVVMELVRGVAITTFCDARRHSVLDRIELFIPICRAVQHAHAKGIIHRDLKPSNILVADDGRTVTPKVIDFSIARAIDRSAEETSYTRNLLLLGTPSYVSPEQAVGSSDTDTRTDIYSLGAVLYQLLCGVPPFDADELSRLATDEFLRRLQQDDPLRPSRRLATLDDAGLIADARRLTPTALRRCLSGDLDRIVMKALDKSPARRYETAAAFADDLERFCRHEPVLAVRASAGYLAMKFARRHRAGLVAGGLVLASVLIGAAIGTWQTIQLAASEDRYHRQAYISDLNLADDALRSNDPRRMKELLDLHIPSGNETDIRSFSWHYLYRTCTAPGRSIDRFGGSALFVRLSPDGTRLAAASADGTIRIYDAHSWKRLVLIESGSEVNGLAFTPDGTQLVSAADDGTLRFWNVASGRPGRVISAFDHRAYQVVFVTTKDGPVLAACGEGPVVKLFDPSDGTLRGELPDHGRAVEAIAAGSDGRLAVAAEDGVPRIWSVEERKLLAKAPDIGSAHLTSVAFSPDGRYVVFGTTEPRYVVWDTRFRKPPRSIAVNAEHPVEGEGVQCVAFAPAGDLLYVADRGGTVRVVEMAKIGGSVTNDGSDQSGQSGQNGQNNGLLRWSAHADLIYAMTTLGEGMQLVTASRDGTIRLWRPSEEPDSWTVPTPTIPNVRTVAVGPDGRVIVAGDAMGDGVVGLFHIQRGLLSTIERSPETLFSAVALSGDGRHVLTATSTATLTLWSVTESVSRRVWRHTIVGTPDISAVALSHDARYGAVLVDPPAPDPKEIRLVDLRTGNKVATVPAPGSVCLAFNRSGTILAGAFNNDVILYDMPSLTIRHRLKGHTGRVTAMTFSSDGRLLATGAQDRAIILWDPAAGEKRNEWVAHGGTVESLSFRRDGRSLLSTGPDAVPKVWETASGRLMLRFPRIDRDHWPLCFLPDQDVVVGPDGNSGLLVFDGRPIDPPR